MCSKVAYQHKNQPILKYRFSFFRDIIIYLQCIEVRLDRVYFGYYKIAILF